MISDNKVELCFFFNFNFKHLHIFFQQSISILGACKSNENDLLVKCKHFVSHFGMRLSKLYTMQYSLLFFSSCKPHVKHKWFIPLMILKTYYFLFNNKILTNFDLQTMWNSLRTVKK